MLLGALAGSPLLLGRGAAAQAQRRVGGAPIALRDGKLWMPVSIGGHGPYDFVIDTGAAMNRIALELARALSLRQIGDRILAGIGGTRAASVYEAQNVRLGNIDVGTLTFRALEGGPHRPNGGAVSASVLAAADADFDFGAGQWRIYPDGRGEWDGYAAVSSEMRAMYGGWQIFVTMAIDGQSYRLQMDTGAPSGVLLYPRAAARSGLWTDARPFAPGQARGIGGPGQATRIVRAGAASMGGIAFPRPLITLSDPQAHSLLESDGLFGLAFIQQLDISSDTHGGRLLARRNALPPPPDHYGLSGMWVEDRGGRPVVAIVSPGSPAAEAGLRPGDAIDGMAFRALVARLGGAPGQVIELTYVRDDVRHPARITLRPFL